MALGYVISHLESSGFLNSPMEDKLFAVQLFILYFYPFLSFSYTPSLLLISGVCK